MTASVLYPAQCYLGEGPFWHAERKSCFWVDIENRKFYEYKWQEKEVQCRSLDFRVSLIVKSKDNNLILGLEGGLARYDLIQEKLVWLMDIEKEFEKHRCNDGQVDSRGRLWLGTLHRDLNQGAGSLYCVDENMNIHKKLSHLTISNGIAWSTDNRRMYFIDSPTNKVQAFLFDESSGQINYQEDALFISPGMGSPDGMAIDEEGMLWIAHWGGFAVWRWNPFTGKPISKIELPVPNITSCAFVGKDLDHLLITTARQDLSPEDLKKYPKSGDVFILKIPVRGRELNKCLF
jgi:sugar lactone lactonase YvrE